MKERERMWKIKCVASQHCIRERLSEYVVKRKLKLKQKRAILEKTGAKVIACIERPVEAMRSIEESFL